MITAVRVEPAPPSAENRVESALDRSGQGLLEFLLLLPFLLGLSVLMIRANAAIQTSIVNQKYARAQTHFLTFNSPYYPDFGLTGNRKSGMIASGTNAITMGVAEKALESGEDEDTQPEAPMQMVARSIAKAGAKPEAQQNSESSGWVRVWNTVTLCTASHSFQSEGGFSSIKRISEGVTPRSFNFCREAFQ